MFDKCDDYLPRMRSTTRNKTYMENRETYSRRQAAYVGTFSKQKIQTDKQTCSGIPVIITSSDKSVSMDGAGIIPPPFWRWSLHR